jgi:hypothetical protein
MSKYRRLPIGFQNIDCPNRCFEKLWQQGIDENTVDGIKPMLLWDYSGGFVTIRVRRWSRQLKRLTRRTNGHYVSRPYRFCPMCGAELVACEPQ